MKFRLDRSKKVVVLTGAGISAESGIPTFRDASGGLWKNFRPEELACVDGFRKNPKLVHEWYSWRRETALNAQPNAAHKVLAEWENYFSEFHLITQNVDGLHRRAGNKNVIEMHGSIHKMKCFSCTFRSEWIAADDVPRCPDCTDHLRPDIVWFGEYLDPDDLKAIGEALAGCDLFLAIGTSGTVYPAAGLLATAKQLGAVTVVVNPDPECGFHQADYYIQDKATTALINLDILKD